MISNSTTIDSSHLLPSEILYRVITVYTNEYLCNFTVERKTLSDNEVLLIIENDLVVDFFLSDYTVQGLILLANKETPRQSKCVIIQELTHNSLFKFNYSSFRKNFAYIINTEFLKFRGINSYRSEIDRFAIVNSICPELNMTDRYNSYEGELYHFVILEMTDITGNTSLGIGYTKNSVHKFVLKIGAELSTKNSRTLIANGSSSLNYALSQDFVTAFLSWQGKKKLWRVENQLTYYYIDVFVKEEADLYNLPKEIITDAKSGKHKHLERGHYKKPIHKWKTEELVYNTIKKLYKNHKVLYQYRPYYLKSEKGRMSYDIYICGLNIAIEYQGKQHFEPIEYFGGKEHYEKQQERDKLKLELSNRNGIKLVYINYWDNITPDLIIERIGINPDD